MTKEQVMKEVSLYLQKNEKIYSDKRLKFFVERFEQLLSTVKEPTVNMINNSLVINFKSNRLEKPNKYGNQISDNGWIKVNLGANSSLELEYHDLGDVYFDYKQPNGVVCDTIGYQNEKDTYEFKANNQFKIVTETVNNLSTIDQNRNISHNVYGKMVEVDYDHLEQEHWRRETNRCNVYSYYENGPVFSQLSTKPFTQAASSFDLSWYKELNLIDSYETVRPKNFWEAREVRRENGKETGRTYLIDCTHGFDKMNCRYDVLLDSIPQDKLLLYIEAGISQTENPELRDEYNKAYHEYLSKTNQETNKIVK